MHNLVNTNPLVSIIVPVYNVFDYLSKCFRSLVRQTYCNIEIILIDDGSTDGSSELCDSLVKSDSRSRVIHQKNKGLGAARNLGAQKSRGDWILFVDSDDYLSEIAVEICVLAQKNTGADHIVFPFIHTREDGVSLEVDRHGCRYGFIDKRDYSSFAIWCIPFHIACSKFYKRTTIQNVLFSEGVHEDIDFSHRVLQKVNRVYVLDSPLYYYRFRQDGLSKKSGINRDRNHYRLLAWMNVLENVVEEDYFEAIENAWNCFKPCLSLSGSFPDDEVYDCVLKRFSKWFCSHRKQLRKLSLKTYLEMRDVSKKTAVFYYSGFKVSHYLRPLFFYLRALGWLRRKKATFISSKRFKRYKKDFIRALRAKTPICVVLPTPHHDNLGDHMIAEGMLRFYESSGYTVAEVPMDLWKNRRSFVVRSIPKTAEIAIIGGGNIGTLWKDANQDILDIVSSFPDNRVVVFPETAFFDESKDAADLLEKDLSIFRKHRNLMLSFRDQQSYKMFSKFEGLECRYLTDTVLFGYPPRKVVTPKKKIALVCFRTDKESVLREETKNEIARQLLSRGYLLQTTSMHCGQRLDYSTRNAAINAQLDLFASASLVVCDTLHGMLFSWLAGTECVCFDNVSGKVSGVHKWIDEYAWIHLISANGSMELPDLGVPVTRQDESAFIKMAKEALLDAR